MITESGITTAKALEKLDSTEIVQGYMDGLDRNSPNPSDNRSISYIHGFLNGRDDLTGKPRDEARKLAIDCRKSPSWQPLKDDVRWSEVFGDN